VTFRAFISVDIGPRLEWHGLRKELTQVDRGVRAVRPEQLHLTLRFLGDIEEAIVEDLKGIMASAVEGHEPFTISFEGVGVFPNPKRARVVWIGIRGAEPMVDIARRLETGVVDLGFKREKRSFRPHATVARVKYLRRHQRLTSLLDRWEDTSFGSMEVRTIELKRSRLTPEGAIYSTVHTQTLGDRGV
jgi:2'-5' RNA ligase